MVSAGWRKMEAEEEGEGMGEEAEEREGREEGVTEEKEVRGRSDGRGSDIRRGMGSRSRREEREVDRQ